MVAGGTRVVGGVGGRIPLRCGIGPRWREGTWRRSLVGAWRGVALLSRLLCVLEIKYIVRRPTT